MRVRLPFAGVFFFLLLIAGYAGLASLQLDTLVNDKVLHVATFFLLTLVFYWVVDTNRRRTLNLTLVVCTGILGVGSEFLQGVLPNGRSFDPYDILANLVGSLAGLALCTWYHKRMLERKRLNKTYGAVPGDDPEDADLELGEGVGGVEGGAEALQPRQDEGVTEASSSAAAGKKMTLEQEVDNWDENAEDAWEEDDIGVVGSANSAAAADPKRRVN